MNRGAVLAAFALVGALPPADASAGLDAGVVHVQTSDGFGSACPTPGAGLACFGRYEEGAPGDPGDDDVSLESGPMTVAVGARPRSVPVLGQVAGETIPGERHEVGLDERHVPFPVFPGYESARDSLGPLPTEPYADARATPHALAWHVLFVNPSDVDPGGPLPRPHVQKWRLPWHALGYVGYDHVEAPNEVGGIDTDEHVTDVHHVGCRSKFVVNVTGTACRSDPVARFPGAYNATTPRVRILLDALAVVAEPNAGAGPPAPPAGAAPAAARGVGSAPLGAPPAATLTAGAPGVLPSGGSAFIDPARRDASPSPTSDAALRWSSRSTASDDGRSPWAWALVVAGPAIATALLLAALAFYSRVTRARVLEQETRQRLHALASARPGVTYAQAARALGIDITTVDYHARKLRQAGFLLVRRSPVSGSLQLFHPHGERPEVLGTDLADLLAHPVAAAVAAAAAGAQGTTRRALREAIRTPVSTLKWHVKRLRAAGILEEAGGRITLARAMGGRAREVLTRRQTVFSHPILPEACESSRDPAASSSPTPASRSTSTLPATNAS